MYRWVRQHYQFQLRGRRFLEAPWSGGLVLLFSVAVAMLLANLPHGRRRVTNGCSTSTSLWWCGVPAV